MLVGTFVCFAILMTFSDGRQRFNIIKYIVGGLNGWLGVLILNTSMEVELEGVRVAIF